MREIEMENYLPTNIEREKNEESKKWKIKIVRGFIYAILYFFALVWLMPLIWVVMKAFQSAGSITDLIPKGHLTLDNFKSVLSAAPFGQYYINTIIIVFVNLGVQMVTATMGAFAFARLKFKGSNILFMLILIQLMIPNDVLIFPNYLILGKLGLVDTKLGVMLPYFGSAFAIFLLRQTFKAIPDELEEAAILDGGNIFRIIYHIFIPLSKPAYVAFGLISVSYHWNNFLWPLIVTNSVNNRPLTVGLGIFAKSYETGAMWAEVSAGTLIISLPLLIGFFVFQRQFIDSFIQSGVKA